MDTEFHYYITYLVASRAGFSPEDARIVAYSSQYVDDNSVILTVSQDTAATYRNYISQTMDILKPKMKLFRIYPLFHFIPGDVLVASSLRRDGAQHLLNTTPDSLNARQMMKQAVASQNLYRLGIAAHAYADTWAHQNFVGYFDSYNAMSGVLGRVAPDIGHASAYHAPDRPARIWKDMRLLRRYQTVNNTARFLDAASHLFDWFCRYRHVDVEMMADIKGRLLADVNQAIGETDIENEFASSRVSRYRALSKTNEYGGTALSRYNKCDWLYEALVQKVRGLDDLKYNLLGGVWVKDVFRWRQVETHDQTHWFQFQEAVKAHQRETFQLFDAPVFSKMELEKL